MKILLCLFIFVLTSTFLIAGDIQSTDPFKDRLGIFYGEQTTIEHFPFMVYLSIGQEGRCGGTVISKNKVLTAAHCVDYYQPDQIYVLVNSSEAGKGKKIKVTKITQHPHYMGQDYDVCVLKTVSNLNIKPIELNKKQVADNTPCTVCGWGRTEKNNEPSKTLKRAQINVYNQQKCKEIFRTKLTDRMMCALNTTTGEGICNGDSGGPLICNGKQSGIVKMAKTCGSKSTPNIFMNIANKEIYDFIKQNM